MGATQSAINAAMAVLIRIGMTDDEKIGSTIIAPEILVKTSSQQVQVAVVYSNSSTISAIPHPTLWQKPGSSPG